MKANSNQPEFWAQKAETELKATEGQLNVYLDRERIKRIKVYSVMNDIPIKDLVSAALEAKYNL
jgi:predicted DNA binding CopG/RHH family protein